MTEIMNIVDTIGRIKQSSARATDSIEHLRAASNAISAVIKEITEISSRMKLISVNASIEASNAGQAGNGFRVVASEFKLLSESTDRAVDDIEKHIQTIRDKIGDVYENVRDNDVNVDSGVTLSRTIEENLSDINRSFQMVNELVERVRTTCEEESAVAGSIESEIGNIESLVRQMDDDAVAVYDSAVLQKNSIRNISVMGERLKAASGELSDLADQSTDTLVSDKILEKLGLVAEEYFSIIEREVLCDEKLLRNDMHRAMLSSFKKSHDQVEAVWTNDINGRFICSIPEAGIANANVREWFRSSVTGEKYVSKVYISGITKNPCITISLPYYKEEQIVGVVGIDLDLGKIENVLHG